MSAVEFEDYYKSALKLTDADFEAFMAAVKTPLPSAFRVTSTPEASEITEKLKKYSFLSKTAFADDVYTFSLQERSVEYKEFIQFLVGQTDIGNIQRQEVVSMLPHFFLDPKEDSLVLETCASPGSKTKQLLETVKRGLVVSNDKSPSRTNVLISEAMKKASPSFVVTTMDATRFPNTNFRFDRICCDVPCSSDGTIRKNQAVMDAWDLKTAMGLCALQIQILKRSLDLLQPEGTLVYSTCSFNPIENEYVISKVLGECQLVDGPALIRNSSKSWSKFAVRGGITEFSNGDISYSDKELEKCVRVFPQDQNTGGFFIAVLKKNPSAIKEPSTDAQKTGLYGLYKVPDEIMGGILEKYKPRSLEKVHYVSVTKAYNNIFCISDRAFSFIHDNPKVKVSFYGLKAFSKTEMVGGGYRAKEKFLQQMDVNPEVQGTMEDFGLLLKNVSVSIDQLTFSVPVGGFSVQFGSPKHKFCGYAGKEKCFIYIDKNQRKALQDIYFS